MRRLRNLLRVLAAGGPRCPLCGVPSPHRSPHERGCDYWRIVQGGSV